ncbi:MULTISPECIES: aldo/keto reductase [Pectobacterium]|uniref:aldo/keto reductase n=1 Tax=Pectobacterium TaxID=122277 RepID=UPI0005018411|nr:MULTISPECIES: aldo/keto reductase [Pectobacterium]KFX10310.1 aldo/keto reductase [Pectobacterium parvum]GKW36716.1 oxidoreductase [Pectobacterium carotovorum subsp. carotovorum]
MNYSLSGNIIGRSVCRIGYGAMRITGPDIWGPPSNEQEIIDIIRLAIDLGVQHIDTADAYGPYISEELIKKALYPYDDNLLIATKGGFMRDGPGLWVPNGDPFYLRRCIEGSLSRLKLEAIDLYYLHRVDEKIPISEQVGELSNMKKEGKIKNIGLSKVTLDQIKESVKIDKIAAIQNKFNRLYRHESEDIIKWCEEENVAFVPYAPFGIGTCIDYTAMNSTEILNGQAAVNEISWLLDYSPNIFPIPSTTNIKHLKQNLNILCSQRNKT